MSDFQSFKHGGVTFPLPLEDDGLGGTGASLLRDCDPAVFFALEYYASVITTHAGARLVADAAAAGQEKIVSAVAETLPCNPENWLTSEHIRFPLLSLYRKSSTFRIIGQRKFSTHVLELAYVLPPMTAAEAERLLPILHAVEVLLDNRTEQGFDPSYTPSTPAGTAGESPWGASRAGVAKVGITASTTGAYTPTADLFFPAVVMTLEMEERSEAVTSELGAFTGADIHEDLTPADDTAITDFVQIDVNPIPVIASLSPSTGAAAGGDAVTITGSAFVTGNSYRVLFDGSDAASVIATSNTTITCLSPAHAAGAADILVIDEETQVSNTLTAAFTFT